MGLTGGRWGLVWLMIATAFVWQGIFFEEAGGKLVFWPEGEDNLFIQTKEGGQILVNGGGDREILKRLGQEMPAGDKELDLVILTSLAEDHLTGLISVLENYKVAHILWSGGVVEGPLFRTWGDYLAAEGAEIIIAQAGRKIALGSAFLEVLAPRENLYRRQLENSEEGEVVWKLGEGELSFLFLGQIPSQSLAVLERNELEAEIVEAHYLQEILPWSFWSNLSPSLVVVSGAFSEENFLSEISLRQTEREGKIVINF